MIYIDGIGYIEDRTSYKRTNNSSAGNNGFDTILQAESTIYATPESNGTQTAPAQSTSSPQTVVTTAEMNEMFKEAADKYGIDVNLLKAVAKAESGFNANAVSSAGAIGVMQLMPGTASSLGVTNPYDPRENIMGGAKYLSQLLSKYNGDVTLALAAYNAGSGNVDKYGGVPPFKETKNYVSKVLGYMGNTDNAVYVSADTAGTIYAVASKDTVSTTRIYSIRAVPESSL